MVGLGRGFMIAFEHLSCARVGVFHAVEQRAGGKPDGVWWARPGEWARFQRPAHSWVATTEVDERWLCDHGGVAAPRLLRLDMGDEQALCRFINRYRAASRERDVDWGRVQVDSDGILFENAGRLPAHYSTKYNHADGCWVLSVDVDSLCVWDPAALGAVHWERRRKRRRSVGGVTCRRR